MKRKIALTLLLAAIILPTFSCKKETSTTSNSGGNAKNVESSQLPPQNSTIDSSSTQSIEPKPYVAENGSYYGEPSKNTGQPKTVYVKGYYRKDGTYVQGHYRSKPRKK